MTFAVGDTISVKQLGDWAGGFQPISLAKVVVASPMMVKDDYGRVFIKRKDGRFINEEQNRFFDGIVFEALDRSHYDAVARPPMGGSDGV